MTYDGKVSVGGPAETRDLPGLTITKVAVGPMDNNAYLLKCKGTGQQLLIDAANDADTLLALIRAGGSPLEKIVTTHQHWDHVGALVALAKETGADTVAHVEDAPALPLAPSELVMHEDTIDVGDCVLKVIHLRGHTPGSIALLYDGGGELAGSPHLFTGDSLFPGGPGNTERNPDRFNSLMTDLEDRIFAELPDGTWVYPGHGGDTTLGAERPHLAEWRARGW
ncbi:MAG TPA: MBL fold metallo-hydrolase [Streptosporangiaceae bacterium]|nr:MBL fold metallo-hydrolase [Streptosporangiaceae bacterium]